MGRKLKRICIECGCRLKNRSKFTLRCRACDIKRRNESSRGRNTGFCMICKIKLSQKKSKTGKCQKCYSISRITWNKGKGTKTSEYQRIKHSTEYKLWRKSVFNRDDYTCQKCFKVGNRIHPHHIKSFKSYPEFRFSVDNGITLCVILNFIISLVDPEILQII